MEKYWEQDKGHNFLTVRTFVCPYPKSCDRFWSLQLKKDVAELERVQRRVAKMIVVMEKLLYEKMLKRTEVFNLENRMMEDEIKIYKRIKAVDKVNEELLFTVPQYKN